MTRLEFYTDEISEWRWRLIGANGEKVGGATEGFASRQKARENYELVVRSDGQPNYPPDDDGA